MKKIRAIFIAVLALALVLSFAACNDKGNTEPQTPALSIADVTGSGTEASPYVLSVENASEVKFKPVISLTGYSLTIANVSGATNATAVLKNGEVTVTGTAVGSAVFKVAITDTTVCAYVKINVTARPVTGINFAEFETGTGTIASPYALTLGLGKSLTTPYSVSPSTADDKTVVWAVGTVAGGVFTANTELGVTAVANAAGNALTIATTKTATVGDAYVRATSGDATAYIKVSVTDVSALSLWDRSAIIADWNIDNCEYDAEETNVFSMPASSSITNKFLITAARSAFTVKVAALSNDAPSAIIVKVNDTAIKSILGFDNYQLQSSKYTSLVYDLSAYIDESVTVTILNDGTNPMLVGGAAAYQIKDTASAMTAWNKDTIASDWSIEAAAEYRTGTGEGFDLNTADNDACEYIYNSFAINADNSRLAIKVRRFGQDSGRVAYATLFVNGQPVAPIAHNDIVAIEDTDGHSSYLVFDLREYIGDTVRVVFALGNPDIGHLTIQGILMDAFDATASELTSWTKDTFISDWDITYAPEYRSGTGEGFDLNTNDNDAEEFIYNYVAITADKAKFDVNVRRFGQDGGNSNKCLVFVNGKLMTPLGTLSGNTVIEDLDRVVYHLVFDLTEYIGHTVQIAILQPVSGRGHLVITEANMAAWDKTPTERTSWTKDTFISDWHIEYAADYREGVGEGFDFNTNDDDANEIIYNYVTITEDATDFVLKVRRFGQDNSVYNACGVFVNGQVVNAAGVSSAYAPIADTEDEITLTYNLDAYVGQTVQILIIQPVPKCGHLVLMNADLQ